jgi:hypothetical protein
VIWISNGDPPLYVWVGDTWYNQKDKITYSANILHRFWWQGNFSEFHKIKFPKKTKVMNELRK